MSRVFVYPTERRMEAYVPEVPVDPYARVAEQNRAYRKRTTLQDLVTFAENRGHQVIYTEDQKLHRIPPSAQIIVQTRSFPTVVVATYRVAKDSPRNDTRQPWNVHLIGEKSFANLHPRNNPRRLNPAYDVRAIRQAAAAAGFRGLSIRNGTGSERGVVTVSWPAQLPGPEWLAQASTWLRTRYPRVPFSGLKPREFCDYWIGRAGTSVVGFARAHPHVRNPAKPVVLDDAHEALYHLIAYEPLRNMREGFAFTFAPGSMGHYRLHLPEGMYDQIVRRRVAGVNSPPAFVAPAQVRAVRDRLLAEGVIEPADHTRSGHVTTYRLRQGSR